MTRFEYKVLKPFALFRDDKGRNKIALSDQEKRSASTFTMVTMYVDYESPKDDIKQDPLTLRLCKFGYLKEVTRKTIKDA